MLLLQNSCHLTCEYQKLQSSIFQDWSFLAKFVAEKKSSWYLHREFSSGALRTTAWSYVRWFSSDLWWHSRSFRYTSTRSSAIAVPLEIAKLHIAFLEATIWLSFIRSKRCIKHGNVVIKMKHLCLHQVWTDLIWRERNLELLAAKMHIDSKLKHICLSLQTRLM